MEEAPLLTQLALARLLAWLDDGTDSSGVTYLDMRRRLVGYFDRRNRRSADELADETLNRIARTLEQGDVIATRPPARYCYVVARFVLLEDFRRDRSDVPFEEGRTPEASQTVNPRAVEPDASTAVHEHRLDCLDRCLDDLKPVQRELIVGYYRDAAREKIERRRELAAGLGISMNALGIRASRIRQGLMGCVEGCRTGGRRV